MKQLKDFFSNTQIKSVLDVGTGTGDFIAVLKDVFWDAKITGVDPDIKSIHKAAKIYSNVVFTEMIGEELDFEANCFDVAAISMSLHHLPDIQKALSEMQRVVKPGGWIIVNELFRDNLAPAQEVHKKIHHFKSKIDRINGICHNETFTRHEIIEIVRNSGLEIVAYFNQEKVDKQPGKNEIAGLNAKMKSLQETIKFMPEYPELAEEMVEIEHALAKNGFQLATCVVVVARVN